MQQAKGKWAARIIRAFGVAEVLMAMFGFFLVLYPFAGFHPWQSWTSPATPYRDVAFLASVAINLLCVSVLLIAGLRVVRLDASGLRLSNLIFSVELFYWISPLIATDVLRRIGGGAKLVGMSIAVVGGSGNLGIAPQTITGFPIIGLVLLNILYPKLSPKRP